MNNKRNDKISFFISRILGERGRKIFVSIYSKFFLKKKELSFPIDVKKKYKILFILPLNKLDSLYQINTVLSLIDTYSGSEFYILCEKDTEPLFSQIEQISEILTYSETENYLFSEKLKKHAKTLKKYNINLTVLLDQKPDISMFLFVARINSQIRIGYEFNISTAPILNIRIRPSQDNISIIEQNLLLANVIGCDLNKKYKLDVSKSVTNEISNLLYENGIKKNDKIIGIDAELFFYKYGQDWLVDLVANLTEFNNFTVFFIFTKPLKDDFVKYVQKENIVVLSDLSLPRLAALINMTTIIISGKSIIFELADLLEVTTVGVFYKDELKKYCRPNSVVYGIPYTKHPDSSTIENIKNYISKI